MGGLAEPNLRLDQVSFIQRFKNNCITLLYLHLHMQSKSRALHCITVFAERVIHCRIENLCNEHTVLVREALY